MEKSLACFAALFLSVLLSSPTFALDLDHLAPDDQARVQSILARLDSLLAHKKEDGSANLLTFEALYRLLPEEDHPFLDQMRSLDPALLGATAHTFPEEKEVEFVKLENPPVRRKSPPEEIGMQFLPRKVHEAYEAMMQAMEKDLGKRLYVESGYRSPAYQLYLFLFYLPKHNYSIRETNRFVALPGHSEHGALSHQAIDFISAEGINGEDHPEEFEALAEYAWLTQHARRFGFVLSYPRDNPWHTSFEPWHWHYEGGN